mmetsp:Transcript_13457/g.26420  ORF Transcript_13457/g.26420 Transcript_13457/m.26420 type:complete len:205 (+) Transcript_13457:140-754(+)
MARVKRCTGAGPKGHKTIFKVGGDGRTFYLITERGVELIRRPKEEKIRKRKTSKKETKPNGWLGRRKKCKRSAYASMKPEDSEGSSSSSGSGSGPTSKIAEGDDSEEKGHKDSEEEEEEFITEEVLDRRWQGGLHGSWEYQVKWKGYQKPTWEPLENLSANGLFNKHLLNFLKRTGYSVDEKPDFVTRRRRKTGKTAVAELCRR